MSKPTVKSTTKSNQKSSVRYALNKNKYLLPHEVLRLREILRTFENRDPRNCLMISLALQTGGRAQEILNLRRVDINTYDQTVFIHGLKGSNDREIPLAQALFTRLSLYVDSQELAASDRIFQITYDRLYQIWELYRPIPKKFHSLRHTFAIELYQKTRDLRLLQVALGHRNITNTMIYADYLYSKEELRRLIL